MKVIGLLGLIGLVGCVSTKVPEQPRFKEPLRTMFVVQCSVRMGATHCLCVEQVYMKRYGSLEEAMKVPEEELQQAHDLCQKKLEKQVGKEIEEYNEKMLREESI